MNTDRKQKEIIEVIRVTTGCSDYTAKRCLERIFGININAQPEEPTMTQKEHDEYIKRFEE